MISKTPLELKGGEAREVEFVWKPTQSGDATLKVSVDEGLKTHHELLWNTIVVSPLDSDANHQGSINESSESQDPSSESGGPVFTELPKNSPPPVPLEKLRWTSKKPWFGKPLILLSWQPAKDAGETYRIEEQVIQLLQSSNDQPSGGSPSIPPFNVVLLPVDDQQVKQDKDADSVKLDKLSAGWHLIVVSKISKDGTVAAQSKLQVFMPGTSSWWHRWRGLLGVCIALVLIFFLRKYREGSA
jgi:hypothetical protein